MHSVRSPRLASVFLFVAVSAVPVVALVVALVATPVAIVGASAAQTPSAPAPQAAHQVVSAKSLTWSEAPPSMRPGARFAVLSGDPSKEGSFTIRINLPDGYRVPPHWHPTDEHLTVIEGTFLVGMGEKFDVAALRPLVAGDYAHMPKEMRHFAVAKGATIVQVHGTGPFALTYVNPDDDPRTKKPTATK